MCQHSAANTLVYIESSERLLLMLKRYKKKKNENEKRAYSQPIMKNVSISFFPMILRMAVAAINIFYRCGLFFESITHFQSRLKHLLLFHPLATMFLGFIHLLLSFLYIFHAKWTWNRQFWCENKKTSVLQRVCQVVCSTHVNLGSIRMHRFVFFVSNYIC